MTTDIHSYRLFNVAIIDFVLTILSAAVISYFTSIPISITLVGLLIIGGFLHWAFGVKSEVNTYLGISPR